MSWLKRSVAAVKRNDPAARTTLEVLLTYPGLHALFWHRLSHFLYRHQLFLLAKIHAQFWRFITGVEIHPGATIEREFYRSRHGHCDWGNRGNRRRCCFVSRSDVRWDRS